MLKLMKVMIQTELNEICKAIHTSRAAERT